VKASPGDGSRCCPAHPGPVSAHHPKNWAGLTSSPKNWAAEAEAAQAEHRAWLGHQLSCDKMRRLSEACHPSVSRSETVHPGLFFVCPPAR
jgi:hypothetical protein